MQFDRHERSEGASWALGEFSFYETQMNSMYWSGEAASAHATYLVRNAASHVPVTATLKATGPNAHRLPQQNKPWLTAMSDLQNWNRACFVLAATGALERFTQRIVHTALLSDPAVVYGKSRAIDGTNWLKIGITVDHNKQLEFVTKGEWTQRYSAIKKLFGDIPLLKHHLAALDEIREFRNSVGHAFGRDLDEEVMSNTRAVPKMLKIKQHQLIAWFQILSESAKALDEVLVARHVGDFEPILHFHAWLGNNKKKDISGNPTLIRAYRKALGEIEGRSKGVDYVNGLIAAYEAA